MEELRKQDYSVTISCDGLWHLKTSLVDNSPTWNDPSTDPPLSTSQALVKTNEIINTLNQKTANIEIGDWKLGSLVLFPLNGKYYDRQHSKPTKWCYVARFNGQPLGMFSGEAPRYSAIIMMDGEIYADSRSMFAAWGRNGPEIEQQMQQIYPTGISTKQ